ncbi:hypothetical protein Tco_0945221 [Tanacetum coccineum]
MHYRERPRGDTTVPAAHLDPDDPYVSTAIGVLIVRRRPHHLSYEDPLWLLPYFESGCNNVLALIIMPPRKMSAAVIKRLVADKVSEAIATDHATRGNAGGSGEAGGSGRARGQAGASIVRECSFTGFMKCNPTIFHRAEGAVELCRCRALTWWNSQVATLGWEVANRTTWTEMKRLMTEEFYPPEEIQRMLWNECEEGDDGERNFISARGNTKNGT